MTTHKARWRLILLSYPCPDCGARPGRLCRTRTGNLAHDYVHQARVRNAFRCPLCGARISAEAQPGDLCDYCQLGRDLDVERYGRNPRNDPKPPPGTDHPDRYRPT